MSYTGFIQRIAERLGYLIYKKGKRKIKMKDSLEHLKMLGFGPTTVIDVGAAYGTRDLYEVFPKAKFLLFEPLLEYKSDLEKTRRAYDADRIFAAAGSRTGTIALNVYPSLVGSSIFRDNQHEAVPSEQREVKLTTIDHECKKRHTSGPYLIKVDVQGAELDVIAGAAETLKDTEAVILETSLYEFYEGIPLINDVIQTMESLDFCVFDLINAHYRPLDDSLGQIDIVFVKKRGRFRKDHRYSIARSQ